MRPLQNRKTRQSSQSSAVAAAVVISYYNFVFGCHSGLLGDGEDAVSVPPLVSAGGRGYAQKLDTVLELNKGG